MLAALLGQWPTYLAYAASYLYLAVIWLNHKSAFTRIREMDIGLHWSNLGILATLGFCLGPPRLSSIPARRAT
ncbi:TMEM175 family protein [Paenarthrobacter sp. AR 02]|uniref:TMEM175 family protein n=1 Tax=Paenarthrobacter sp. AR 02 TaxID=2899821 RepID=UPI0027DEE963|nr:TMEM175 family protein [Paenarthrobacter sp. AR 02]